MVGDRLSYSSALANQMRLILHSADYVMIWIVRAGAGSNSEFSTIKEKLIKAGAAESRGRGTRRRLLGVVHAGTNLHTRWDTTHSPRWAQPLAAASQHASVRDKTNIAIHPHVHASDI